MTIRVHVQLTAADLARERPNLERGSVVAPGAAGLALGACCQVEVAFPSGERYACAGRAVLATPAGMVLAFEGHDRSALARLLASEPVTGPAAAISAPATASPPAEPAPGDAAAQDDPEGGPEHHAPAHVHERLRGLPVVEQLRVAREGNLSERVVLERLYGKTVWEALLRNPHLTVPEVCRLARLGTMPRPLLDLLMGNPAWLQVPQVRRALLANPRLSADMIHKVLQLLPREELKVVPQTTAYPAAVRMAAKAMTHR